jgi:hypothetical protein
MGTFIFWAANGQRVAVIPYDGDAKSGTVATWYAEPAARGDLRRKLEAPYVRDVLHGLTRSWHASGRLRGEYRYERGELVEARGWAENGARLHEEEVRRMAGVDRASAEAFYGDLDRPWPRTSALWLTPCAVARADPNGFVGPAVGGSPWPGSPLTGCDAAANVARCSPPRLRERAPPP